jgi:Holliday junction resolvase-like predicted endonuclease
MRTLTINLRPEDNADNWIEENYIDISGNLKHEDKPTTRKGNIGENLIRKSLVDRGWVCTSGWTSGAEPADIICQRPPKVDRLIAVEVKTKNPYDGEYGINANQYETYQKLKIPVELYFINAQAKTIYWIQFSELVKLEPRTDSFPDGKLGRFFAVNNLSPEAVIDSTVVEYINKWSNLIYLRKKNGCLV